MKKLYEGYNRLEKIILGIIMLVLIFMLRLYC